jgi:hypothetical protein
VTVPAVSERETWPPRRIKFISSNSDSTMLSCRMNPVYLSQSPSCDSLDSPLGTPRTKLVATCLNCSYSFRMGSSGLADFCTKGTLHVLKA